MHRETETLPVFTPKVDAKFVREYQEARRTELSPLRPGKFNIPTYSITLRERKKVTIKESIAASSVDTTTSVADLVEASIRIIPSDGAYRVQVQFPEATETAMRMVVVE